MTLNGEKQVQGTSLQMLRGDGAPLSADAGDFILMRVM